MTQISAVDTGHEELIFDISNNEQRLVGESKGSFSVYDVRPAPAIEKC